VKNLIVVFLLTMTSTLPTLTNAMADERPVAVAGYQTGEYFLNTLLPAAGAIPEDRRAQPPLPGEYSQYSAVIWDDQIEDPNALDSAVLWETPEAVEQVTDYVKSGGRIVLTGSGIPVSTKQIRKLGAALDLIGVTGVPRSVVRGKVKIVVPDDPIFEGLSIPVDGFEWCGEHGKPVSGATTAKVLATAKDDGGNDVPFITVAGHGDGKVYWVGISPYRLHRSGAPSADKEAFARVLMRMIGRDLPVTPASSPTSAYPKEGPNGWGLIPLGESRPFPEITRQERPDPDARRRSESRPPGEQVVLAQGGIAMAFLVVADDAPASTRDAAQFLKNTLQTITGADFPVVAASSVVIGDGGRVVCAELPDKISAIVVGESEISRQIGITASDLPEEGFRFETRGNALVFVGRDSNPKGLETFGTRFGIIDFLEAQTGARWLWPGKTGTVLPAHKDLVAAPLAVSDSPALSIRKLRNLGGSGAAYQLDSLRGNMEELARYPDREQLTGFTRRMADGLDLLGVPFKDFSRRHGEVLPWFDMMRLGMHLRVNAGHAFHGWYEKHHKDHPDWFALQPDGTRNQVPVRETMCTSNSGFRAAAARQALAEMKANPTIDGWSASLNDGGQNAFCMCEDCRRQDPPDGPRISFRFTLDGKDFSAPYVAMTDRIVDYYNAVAAGVTAQKPEALVGAQAYSYYRTPPLQTALHPALVISFVGFSYLDHSRHFTDLAGWDKWSRAANKILLRPNTLHTGHGFPAVFTTRLGKDLAHCYRTGMIGADFDSVMHHWSTQGLNYYVLAKLLWNPFADTEAIVGDYCRSGFGPAASEMQSYYSEIESISEQVAGAVAAAVESALREEEELNTARFALDRQITEMCKAYSPATIDHLRSLLAAAKEKAAGREEILARIAFVSRGLDYAEAQRTFYAAVGEGRGREALDARQQTFRDLFNNDYLAVNVAVILWRETALLSSLGIKTAKP